MTDILTETNVITLNSNFATKFSADGYNNLVRFSFTNILMDLPTLLYTTISIESASIPYSFYNVNENNNVVKIRTTDDVGNVNTHTLTLTKGNYNASNFITEFTGKYTIATSGKVAIMTIERTTGIYNLTPATSSPQITQIEIINSGSTAFNFLGLGNTDHTFTYNLTNPSSFDFPANFLGATELHVYSEALSVNNIDSKTGGANTLLFIIPVNASTFGLINFDAPQHIESLLRNKYINDIDIIIKDQNGKNVNFNFADWSMTFVIKKHMNQPQTFRVNEEIDMTPSKKLDLNDDVFIPKIDADDFNARTLNLEAIKENIKDDLEHTKKFTTKIKGGIKDITDDFDILTEDKSTL